MINFKYKKINPNVPSPLRMSSGAAGFDLCTTVALDENIWGEQVIPTGIAIELPKGCFGMVALRSSMAKYFRMMDSIGIIDSDYRGEILLQLEVVKFRPPVPIYSRIAQLVIMQNYAGDFIEVDQLVPTQRGEAGFGSTGY